MWHGEAMDRHALHHKEPRPPRVRPRVFGMATQGKVMPRHLALTAALAVASFAAPAFAQNFAPTDAITQSGTSLVAKAASGTLYSAYAVNTSATAGFIAIINAAAVPAAAAAITPQECVPIAANSTAGVNYASNLADAYTAGIVILLSTSCATYTAGPTGFIKARVQ